LRRQLRGNGSDQELNRADNSRQQHHPGYASGPQAIWSLFCNGNKIASEQGSSWCFDASTNMSYAKYSTTDRWKWVDGCVHEHVSDP